MLQQDGGITFVDELITLVETLLASCERERGAAFSEPERGLALAYALGVLQCDLCALGDALAQAPEFGTQHPLRLFEECCTERRTALAPERERQLQLIGQRLRECGWPHAPQEGTAASSLLSSL